MGAQSITRVLNESAFVLSTIPLSAPRRHLGHDVELFGWEARWACVPASLKFVVHSFFESNCVVLTGNVKVLGIVLIGCGAVTASQGAFVGYKFLLDFLSTAPPVSASSEHTAKGLESAVSAAASEVLARLEALQGTRSIHVVTASAATESPRGSTVSWSTRVVVIASLTGTFCVVTRMYGRNYVTHASFTSAVHTLSVNFRLKSMADNVSDDLSDWPVNVVSFLNMKMWRQEGVTSVSKAVGQV
jgi:hypothetical protein